MIVKTLFIYIDSYKGREREKSCRKNFGAIKRIEKEGKEGEED